MTTTPTYQQLLAQGVPPDKAAELIYNNLKSQPAKVQVVTVPRTEQSKAREAPRRRGRPINPLSRQRVLAAVVLAQAYRSNDKKRLTLDQIYELMTNAYKQAGVKATLPTSNSVQNTLSKLRQGKIKGFPPIMTQGPMDRHNASGKLQQVIEIEPRDRTKDISESRVDLALVPSWVVR